MGSVERLVNTRVSFDILLLFLLLLAVSADLIREELSWPSYLVTIQKIVVLQLKYCVCHEGARPLRGLLVTCRRICNTLQGKTPGFRLITVQTSPSLSNETVWCFCAFRKHAKASCDFVSP